MRPVITIVFVAALMLTATGVYARECCVPAQAGSGPAAGLTPCQQAGVGAGPAPTLQCLTGPAFDRAYVALMYQLHTDIAALATQGIQQLTNRQLKNLSGKIQYEQTKQNEKLSLFYQTMGCGAVPVGYAKAQEVWCTIRGFKDWQFNVQYAKTMATLLQQQLDAATLGTQRLSNPELRDQAGIVANAAQNEVLAMQRWVDINATMPVPAQGTY